MQSYMQYTSMLLYTTTVVRLHAEWRARRLAQRRRRERVPVAYRRRTRSDHLQRCRATSRTSGLADDADAWILRSRVVDPGKKLPDLNFEVSYRIRY